jgi:hypothetical protein
MHSATAKQARLAEVLLISVWQRSLHSAPLQEAVTRLHGFALSIENTRSSLPRRPDEDGGLIAPRLLPYNGTALNLEMMG